jgi:hypothetical protein
VQEAAARRGEPPLALVLVLVLELGPQLKVARPGPAREPEPTGLPGWAALRKWNDCRLVLARG